MKPLTKLTLATLVAACSLVAETGYMEGQGYLGNVLDDNFFRRENYIVTKVVFPKSTTIYKCGFENYPYGDFSCERYEADAEPENYEYRDKFPQYYLRTTIDGGSEDPAIAFSSSGPFREYVVGNKEGELDKPINPEAILMEHKEEYVIFKDKAKINQEAWHDIVCTFETGDEASTRGKLYFRIYKDGKRVEFNTEKKQFVSALRIGYVKESPNENFDLIATDEWLKAILFKENLYIWGGGLKFSKKELQEKYNNRWVKFTLAPIYYGFLE